MVDIPGDIVTGRLVLRHLTAEFLAATVAGISADRLGAMLDLAVPGDWMAETALAQIRLDDLRADPGYAPWSLRAVGLAETGEMIGHAGFHSRPGGPWPHAVEFGYTVFPRYRRRGFAREAAIGLMRWASAEHGVARFIGSTVPSNTASAALLAGLGFSPFTTRIDDVDGPENVLFLEDPKLMAVLGGG